MIVRSHRVAGRVLIFFLLVTMVAAPLLAQEITSDYLQGRTDGERDGKAEANQLLWGLAGAGCGIFGVGAAYLIEPSVPMARTIGKSPGYVSADTDAYRSTRKQAQTTGAMVGCLAWALVYSMVVAASGY